MLTGLHFFIVFVDGRIQILEAPKLKDLDLEHCFHGLTLVLRCREAVLIDPVIDQSERDAKLVKEMDLKLK
jgi:hypothetical protein